MIVKQRTIPEELLIWRYLEKRMVVEERQRDRLEKGYAGELQWDALLEEELSSSKDLIMNDLLLTNSAGTTFQIDSLLYNGEFILFEVKNYDGEYFLEDDRWYTMSKTEIQNPLTQLQRTETAFRRLLKDLAIPIPVESYVVFVNPEFTLFHAPINPSIILPSQLNRFLKKLNKDQPIRTIQDQNFAERIVSCHIEKSPYSRSPSYSYEELTKGILCTACGMPLYPLSLAYLSCHTCGKKESIKIAVLRNVTEYQKLFPNKPLTTTHILDWCGGILSEKTVRSILKQNFEPKGANRHTYYV